MSIITNPPDGFSIGRNRGKYTWWCTKCHAERSRGVVPATVKAEIIQHMLECRHPKTWICVTGRYQRIWNRLSLQAARSSRAA